MQIPCSAALLITLALSAGCTSLSGVDGSSSYACKAPDGVKCDSVSGTYHNALQNNLPSQRGLQGAPSGSSDPATAPPAWESPSGATGATPMPVSLTPTPAGSMSAPALPLRSGPRIVRLWIKPWEDADRDLHGESVVYVQVDGGRWMVDHAQRPSREAYAPVRPGRQIAPARPLGAADPPPAADNSAAVAQALRALQARPTVAPPPSNPD